MSGTMNFISRNVLNIGLIFELKIDSLNSHNLLLHFECILL